MKCCFLCKNFGKRGLYYRWHQTEKKKIRTRTVYELDQETEMIENNHLRSLNKKKYKQEKRSNIEQLIRKVKIVIIWNK